MMSLRENQGYGKEEMIIKNIPEFTLGQEVEKAFKEIERVIARLKTITDESNELTPDDQKSFYGIAGSIEEKLDILFDIDQKRARKLHAELAAIGDDFDAKYEKSHNAGVIINNDTIRPSRDEKAQIFFNTLPDLLSDKLKDRIVDAAIPVIIGTDSISRYRLEKNDAKEIDISTSEKKQEFMRKYPGLIDSKILSKDAQGIVIIPFTYNSGSTIPPRGNFIFQVGGRSEPTNANEPFTTLFSGNAQFNK